MGLMPVKILSGLGVEVAAPPLGIFREGKIMSEPNKRKPVDKCPACGRSVVYKSNSESDPPVDIPYNYRKKSVHQCKITAAEKRRGLITRFWRSRHVYQEIWYAQGN